MKKRILFVDDEPLVLERLQRMLRPMRMEWELVFVTTGAKVLELMGQAPFEVVVADMRMPGMNGAELLAEVLNQPGKCSHLAFSPLTAVHVANGLISLKPPTEASLAQVLDFDYLGRLGLENWIEAWHDAAETTTAVF